ncbi:MAG TPA: hypothetical protein VIN75_22190 [Burkholderiaceae bacterium]
MTELLLMLLVLFALAARTFQVRHRTAGWECLWRFRSGPCTVELRRHAGLARLGGDSCEYPQPREFRVMALRIGGIPLWSQQAIISLPTDADSRIGEVPASEFDHLFDRHFRMSWPRQAKAMRRLAARAH